MKAKNALLTSALLISVAAFAQKDQLKSADKAFKKGNMPDVTKFLNEAESLLPSASDAEKAQYHYLRGAVYMDAVDKNLNTNKNLSLLRRQVRHRTSSFLVMKILGHGGPLD